LEGDEETNGGREKREGGVGVALDNIAPIPVAWIRACILEVLIIIAPVRAGVLMKGNVTLLILAINVSSMLTPRAIVVSEGVLFFVS
jgi:hypothetical protein